MAGFKAHMAFGMVTAAGWSVVVVIFSLLSPAFLPLIFLATVIGSFLPDLDSDEGTPLKILLITLSTIGGLNMGYIVFQNKERLPLEVILYASLYAFFIYFIIGGIFKKITHHRGMFHSIPAVLLATLIALSFFNYFILDPALQIVLSLSIGIGYLCHLVLDEMNSVVNLRGMPFVPNKALGTALKLYSNNLRLTLGIYFLIIVLAYYYYPIIVSFYESL